MPNVVASPNVSGASSSPAQHLGARNAIHGACEQYGAIFTDLRHASPRKLPRHSHELVFAPVLDGHYRERCGRSEGQYTPFTLDVPHVSLSELSFATGFADQSHFTRAFRKITGMSRAAFRSAFSRAG